MVDQDVSFQTWRDYKLSWNASEFGGIDVVRLLPSSIWKPDVVLYNRSSKNLLDSTDAVFNRL